MERRVRICPRCKVPMTYVQEVERSGGERRIVRYYKCPVCGLRLLDEVMKIVRVNGSVKIVISAPEPSGEGVKQHHHRGRRRKASLVLREV